MELGRDKTSTKAKHERDVPSVGRGLAKVETKARSTLLSLDRLAAGKVGVENVDGATKGVDSFEVGIDAQISKYIELRESFVILGNNSVVVGGLTQGIGP